MSEEKRCQHEWVVQRSNAQTGKPYLQAVLRCTKCGTIKINLPRPGVKEREERCDE